jgi:hypothetical protein
MTVPALIASVRAFEARLAVPVTGWRQAVGGWNIQAQTFEALVDALVVPLRRTAPELLDFDGMLGEVARELSRSPEPAMRQQVQRRLRNVVIELLGAEPDLLRGLSDMARETATYRTLIASDDRFDVSAAAVLGAVALSNYAHALDHFRQHHARPLAHNRLMAVSLPLTCVAEGGIPLKPGDLWFLDLAARTVCLSEEILPAEALSIDESASGPNSARELVQLAAPRFVGVSLLAKLLGAGRLPVWLVQKAKYKWWPGIELLVADAGAESVRNVIVGELARQVAADGVGLAQAALIRFLAALLQFDEPATQLNACLLIADLFWEMLECDDKLLGRLYAQPKFVSTLRAALTAVEQPLDRFADFPDARSRLSETRSLLRTIDQYRTFVSLAALAQPGKPSPAVRTIS